MRNIVLLIAIVSGVTACRFGSNSSSVPPNPYLFSNLVIDDMGTANCTSQNAGFTFICGSNSNLRLRITYSSQPASYIVMPTNLPLGVESSLSGICSTEPVFNYSCTINMAAVNVGSGATYGFLLIGSLGIESFITVIYN